MEGRQLSRIGAEVVRRRDGGDEIDTHYKVFTLIQPNCTHNTTNLVAVGGSIATCTIIGSDM